MMNWGCGSIRPEGWINVDLPNPEDFDFVRWDATRDPAPWEPGSFEGIVANHSLCAVPYHDVATVVAKLAALLAPGAALRLILPDVASAFYAWSDNDLAWFPNARPDDEPAAIHTRLCEYLTWFSTNVTPFVPGHAYNVLTAAGLYPVFVRPGETASSFRGVVDLDDRVPESFYIEGIRRG